MDTTEKVNFIFECLSKNCGLLHVLAADIIGGDTVI